MKNPQIKKLDTVCVGSHYVANTGKCVIAIAVVFIM